MIKSEMKVSPSASPSASIDWDAVKARLQKDQETLEKLFLSDPVKNQNVFRERALRMAARVRDQAHIETFAVMSFQLGKERYGLPIADLAEIIPYNHCTPIPGCPPELKGAVSVRGEIRCVIDLGSLLGVAIAPEDEEKGYILLLRHEEFEIGLKVCSIHQVDTIDKAQFENHGNTGTGMIGHYVKGVGQNSMIFLNLNQVLTHSIFKGVA